MKAIKFISILTVAALMSSCCFCRFYERKYGKPLQGTPWTLIQLDGQNVEKYYLLTLDAHKGLSISGYEELTATYAHNKEGKIRITDLRPADSALAARLAATDGWKMNGPFLMLTANGELWAMFEAKGPVAASPL